MTLTINVVGGTKIITTETISPGSFAVGVNLSGMEYGGAGATQNVNYVVPSLSELQYYKSQGTDLIRLPISWETLQTTLGGALTAPYLANIKTVLSEAASLGMKVIIDLHNFGSYKGVKLGTSAVTDADFASLWKQLATAVKGSAGLGGYDLMNEPNNMPSATSWTNAAQAAITAIRSMDTATPIYVEGNNYASAYNWSSINPGLATLVDPSHNLIFSAHIYLDSDDSGTHYDWTQQAALGTTTATGVNRLGNFVAWLKEYNLKGDIGEIGVGNDNSAWLLALDNTLSYAKANNLQTTYWAGGAWWGSYPMSVEPQNGVSAAQMAILDKYSGDYEKLSVAKVSGTATANSNVYLSQNDVLLATVKASATGSWSYTFTSLAKGVHTIVAGTTPPIVDGTIAAVTFDLVAAISTTATTNDTGAAITTQSTGSTTPTMDFITPAQAGAALAAIKTPAELTAGATYLESQLPAQYLQTAYFKTTMAELVSSETSLLTLHAGTSAYTMEATHAQGLLLAIVNHA